jgi:Family of unknown function (DUF5302)
MADAEPGAEPDTSKPTPPAAAAPERARAEDELSRKFREALERKRARQADGTAQRGGKGRGKVAGAHGPAQSRRSFRRKSGG